MAAGLISVLSFVLVAWLLGNHNAALPRIVAVDLVASVALLEAQMTAPEETLPLAPRAAP